MCWCAVKKLLNQSINFQMWRRRKNIVAIQKNAPWRTVMLWWFTFHDTCMGNTVGMFRMLEMQFSCIISDIDGLRRSQRNTRSEDVLLAVQLLWNDFLPPLPQAQDFKEIFIFKTHSFYNGTTSPYARENLCSLNKLESLHKWLFCYPKGGVQQLAVQISTTKPEYYEIITQHYIRNLFMPRFCSFMLKVMVFCTSSSVLCCSW